MDSVRAATLEHPLVLGSGSPRRREIMGALGVPFVVRVGGADEAVGEGEAADAYLERVVLAKLAAVGAGLEPELRARVSCVLAADTSVVVDGAILGKPEGVDERRRMITLLSGRAHEVKTRFAVATPGGRVVFAETVSTTVTFRAIDDAEADAYAASGEGADKAGGYAIQGRAAAFAARIDGSYSCVVGLPACEVSVALRALGIAT